MPFCGYCSTEVDTPFCTTCGRPTVVQGERSPSYIRQTNSLAPAEIALPEPQKPATREANVKESPRRNGFYRTPAQVLLLAYTSFGVYELYYMLRGRRLAQRRLGEPEESYWTGLKLIIPIYGFFYYFLCWNKIGERTSASGIQPPVPFGIQVIPMFAVDLGWRAFYLVPDPYWFILLLNVLVLGTIHASVARAERVDEPDYIWPRLHWGEWTIIIIGSVLILLDGFGMSTDAPSAWYVTGVIGFMVLSVAGLHLAYGHLRTPSPLGRVTAPP